MRFWPKNRNAIPLERATIASFIIAALFAFLSGHPWAERLENVIARPLEFEVRRYLKRGPTLDPRLQIYVVEDSTVQYLKKESLNLNDWATVITGFRDYKPRVVLIDKVFGIPATDSEAKEFTAKMKRLPYPVIAGGFIVQSAIKNRPLLPIYDLNDKITPGTSKIVTSADELDFLAIEPGYPYGPAENIRDAFRYVGHIMYSGNSYFKPLVRISTYQGLPGAPLFTAKDIHLSGHQIIVDEKPIPIDRKGRTLVNFVSPSLFYDRTERLSQLFELAKAKQPFPKIPEDSVIILLPSQFTGNTDLKETPFGILPGGYLISSVANSVVSGNWLRLLPMSWLAPFFAGAFGAMLISTFGGVAFWFTVLTALLGIILLGLVTFSYFNMAVPWFYSTLSLLASSCIVYAMNARELLRRRIEGIAGTASPIEVKYDVKTGQPKKLGRYHVIERIGKGGMGEVYRAKIFGAGGFEKEFALKRVAPEYWTDKTVIHAFLDEAKLSSYLNHLNIVQVFELLRLEDSYLLVMEYVKGKNLSDVISILRKTNRPFPRELAIYVVSQVCKALEYAHSITDPHTARPLKLVHRDVSPHNILLSDEGNVKVIDFGIAKGTFTTEHTKTGLIKGKLAYMSPEQALGKPLDKRSDLFATALVLYELITGKRALGGAKESELETLHKARHWNSDMLNLAELDIAQGLKKILKKGLEREPENRYQRAEEMYRDFGDLLAESRFGIGQKALAEFVKQLSVFLSDQKRENTVSNTNADESTRISQVAIDDKKTGTY